MRVFLIGMMGSGKSTIGRILSSVLDKEFIDMDSEIERVKGMSISEIFEKEGEKEFRRLEKNLLKELVRSDEIVVSTGGGLILDKENRQILKGENVVYLRLPPADLYRRVSVKGRPLLKEGKESIFRVWEERRELYEQFPSVDTSCQTQWETVAAISMKIAAGESKTLSSGSHPVSISPGGFKSIGRMPNTVVSRRVQKIFSELIPSSALSIDDGEEAKGFHTLFEIYEYLMDRGLSRSDMVVGAGGGTVTDLVGFASSTFKRGIPITLYPTTLLAQVDASIGGKNGLNFKGCKNVVGNFYMPYETIIDPVVTLSMDEGRFEEGLVEAFKIFLITGRWYENFKSQCKDLKNRNLGALSEMLEEAIKQKDKIVAIDTREAGIRRILNLGHTLGHLYEPLAGVSHGMAVAWGLEREMHYFANLGLVDEGVYREVSETLSEIVDLDFPQLPVEDALRLLRNDKKAMTSESMEIEIPLVRTPGSFEFAKVRLDDLLAVVV
ncbi:MAG: 3-dehydroquinate synthetase [Mesotoga infera]|uniref:Shikimate kinase n=2 Tax=Mesotoga infera TaxID=1236046 RepID=A0A101GZG0_9BACT|nr:MAG: 3-dehydroquinate synthetase [Mesotoga infera]KUK89340.1 MAG: 3-dehydroquinate synthetase [Mesotoga infera]